MNTPQSLAETEADKSARYVNTTLCFSSISYFTFKIYQNSISLCMLANTPVFAQRFYNLLYR